MCFAKPIIRSDRGCKATRFGIYVFLSVACSLIISCNPSRAEFKRKEIDRLWSRVPVYPGMVETNNSSASGFDKAYVSKSFSSDTSYEEVKRFYLEQLAKEGWQLSNEKELKKLSGGVSGEVELEFRKGEYDLTIDYAPKDLNYGWNYAIAIGWR
jgi:hypothetical protein